MKGLKWIVGKVLKWIERGVDAAKRIESLGKYLAALAALVLFAVSLNDRKSQAEKELGHQVQVLDQLMAFEATAQAMEQSAESVARSSREMVRQTSEMAQINKNLRLTNLREVTVRLIEANVRQIGMIDAKAAQLAGLSYALKACRRRLEMSGDFGVLSWIPWERERQYSVATADRFNYVINQLDECESASESCRRYFPQWRSGSGLDLICRNLVAWGRFGGGYEGGDQVQVLADSIEVASLRACVAIDGRIADVDAEVAIIMGDAASCREDIKRLELDLQRLAGNKE